MLQCIHVGDLFRPGIVWSTVRLELVRPESAARRVLLGVRAHLDTDRHPVREVRRQGCGHVHLRHLRTADRSDAGAGAAAVLDHVRHALSDRLRIGKSVCLCACVSISGVIGF